MELAILKFFASLIGYGIAKGYAKNKEAERQRERNKEIDSCIERAKKIDGKARGSSEGVLGKG